MKDNKRMKIYASEVLALSIVEKLQQEMERIERKSVSEITRAEIRHWKSLKEMQKAVMQ